MASLFKSSLLAAALLAAPIFAQTYTDCSPLNETCPDDAALSTTTYSVDFTQGADNDSWTVTAGTIDYTSAGAEFSVAAQGDAPTIETSWYFFFGRIEVWMMTAPGTGIISSAVLESDVLDEVDWEWLGGIDNQVQTDYFGKGNSTLGNRGGITNMTDAQSSSHNYTIDWTTESIVWYVDGAVIRTLTYAEALEGANYPQTPMRLKLGIWAGGDPTNSEGTIAWAGGETDYTAGPYTMTVQNVTITNANPGGSYTYSDKTGDYTSIVVNALNETDSAASGSSSSSATASSTTVSSSTASSATSKSTKTSATGTSTATSTASSTSSSSTASSTATSAGSALAPLALLPGVAALLAALSLL